MLLRRYYEDYNPKQETKVEKTEVSLVTPQETQTAESTSYEELTNQELKALLDDRGVQYSARANKAQLIELLEG